MDTPAPPDEGSCICQDFHSCEVSASARGVYDELKASLRSHRVYPFSVDRFVGLAVLTCSIADRMEIE